MHDDAPVKDIAALQESLEAGKRGGLDQDVLEGIERQLAEARRAKEAAKPHHLQLANAAALVTKRCKEATAAAEKVQKAQDALKEAEKEQRDKKRLLDEAKKAHAELHKQQAEEAAAPPLREQWAGILPGMQAAFGGTEAGSSALTAIAAMLQSHFAQHDAEAEQQAAAAQQATATQQAANEQPVPPEDDVDMVAAAAEADRKTAEWFGDLPDAERAKRRQELLDMAQRSAKKQRG